MEAALGPPNQKYKCEREPLTEEKGKVEQKVRAHFVAHFFFARSPPFLVWLAIVVCLPMQQTLRGYRQSCQ